MARRGTNIYKRKDGRWEGRYKIGCTENGKAKYRSVYGKSYSAVREIMEQRKAELVKDMFPCKCTVGELAGLWITALKPVVKESTYANYMMKLKKHILPFFSGIKYDALNVQILNDFINQKLNSGLSAKYVSDIVLLLKSAAKFGSRNYGYINRIEYVTMPKSKVKKEKSMLSEQEQCQLRKYLLNSTGISELGILLASSTGIRIGELCALKWSDIDLKKSIMTVRRTVQRIQNDSGKGTRLNISAPKSRSSVREIPLPDFLIPALKSVQSSENDYFLSGSGKPVEPRTMQYRFANLLKKLELPKVSFHSIRHAFATNCIALGFDVKTLSEILGHSSVKITLDCYVHSSIERKRSFMNLISSSIGAA